MNLRQHSIYKKYILYKIFFSGGGGGREGLLLERERLSMNLISTRGSGATIQEGCLFEGATIREDMVCIHSFIPPPHWIFPKKPWFGRGWAISPKAGGMENAGGGDG